MKINLTELLNKHGFIHYDYFSEVLDKESFQAAAKELIEQVIDGMAKDTFCGSDQVRIKELKSKIEYL